MITRLTRHDRTWSSRLIHRCCLIGSIWIMAVLPVAAQDHIFLPKSRFLVGLEVTEKTFDSVLVSDLKRRSLLNHTLRQNGLEEATVSGDMAMQEVRYEFDLRYGLTSTVNLGVTLPYLFRERRSQLRLQHPEATAFIERYTSAAASGMGDCGFQVGWRPVYTDNHDVQTGFQLIADSGNAPAPDGGELALGEGAKAVTAYLQWWYFASRSTWSGRWRLALTANESRDIKDQSGHWVRRTRGNQAETSIDIGVNRQRFHFGGGVGMVSKAVTRLDEVSLEDGYLGYEMTAVIGYGNTALLENGPVGTPWEAQLELGAALFGTHQPATRRWALRVGWFF
jgi:hypothetical protein